MRFADAMKDDSGVYPGDGTVGRERADWCTIGQLRVESGSLEIADLGRTTSVQVKVANGVYRIEGKLIDFGGSLCLSRVRAFRHGVDTALAPRHGKLSVDFGAVMISDFQSIEHALNTGEMEELHELLPSFMSVLADECRLNFASKTVDFVVCKAGFGDGTYPVFTLISDGHNTGLEIEFIRHGHVLRRGH